MMRGRSLLTFRQATTADAAIWASTNSTPSKRSRGGPEGLKILEGGEKGGD